MAVIAKIDDREITPEQFVKLLKLNGKFDQLVEDIVIDQLTVAAAKKQGISVSVEEVQKMFDNIRRVRGLHRAKDANDFLDNLGVTLDDFQEYIADNLYRDKVLATVYTEQAVQEYFNLNSPKFDSVEVGHIVVDSEGKAREMMAVLHDDPDGFGDLAVEHSMDAETKDAGGVIGKVWRGSLPNEIEAKIFNASAGDMVGPFKVEDGLYYEIFKVLEKHPAQLDDKTTKEIRKAIYDEWIAARVEEHRVEVS